MRAGGDDVEHGVIRGDRRQRHDPAAEGLAEHVDVGHDLLVVAGEGVPGARQTGLDLVGDHEHVPLGAQRPDVPQEAVRRDDDTTLALDRLEQHRDRLVAHCGPQRLDVAIGHDDEAGRVGPVIVPGDLVGGEGHDRRGAAMEVAGHDDDGAPVLGQTLDPPTPAARHLERCLNRLRAGIHRQHKVFAGQGGEITGERAELIGVERPRGERQRVQLPLRRRHEPWMPVPEVERRIAGQRIEIAPPLHIPHEGTLAAGDDDIQRAVVARGIPAFESDVVGGGGQVGHGGLRHGGQRAGGDAGGHRSRR